MMNNVVLIGRLGADPELKYTSGEKPVTKFRIAVQRNKEEVDWIPIVVFGQPAEFAANYLNKGSLVALQGRLQVRQWEKDGSKQSVTEVVAFDVKSLDKREKKEYDGW